MRVSEQDKSNANGICLIQCTGKWHNPPAIPNNVLINLGLIMEAWTSGNCVATLHRVVFPGSPLAKARRSIAYFGTPDPEVLLRPVLKGGIVDESKPAPKVKEFFAERKDLANETVQEVQATA